MKEIGIKTESNIVDKITSPEQLLREREIQNEETSKSYKHTVPFLDETDRKDSKAKAYQQLGNVSVGNGDYKKAIEYYQKAHKMSPDREAEKIEITAYQWLGYNHLQAYQYKESIPYYNEALELASQLGDKSRGINAHLGLGSAFSNTGDFESSRKYYSKVLTIAKLSKDKPLEREVHTNLGVVYYKSGGFDTAVNSYLKAEEISHDHNEKKEEANACLMLGHSFRQLKQHEKAVESYQKALTINKELKEKGMVCFEKAQEGIINEWCGYCCRCIAGKHEEAIAFYKKAKEIAKQDGGKYQEYRVNQAIGNIFCNCNIGNYEKAKKHYQEALENAMELRDRHCEGTSYLDLALVSDKDCDHEMAIKWYEKALDIFGTELDDHPLKNKALIGLGNARLNFGNNPQEATESIRSAQKFAKEETDKDHPDDDLTHQHKDSAKEMSSSQTSDSGTEKETKALQQEELITDPASVSGKDSNYEMPKDWYENELDFSGTAFDDFLFGSRINWFYLRNTQKETESIRRAPKFAKEETDKETEPEREEIHEDEKEIWFENTFLDSKRKIKEEIHEELRRFPWLCGAYGLTAPTKKISRPHIYLTVKRGTKKADVRGDLEDIFKCDAKEYFELLQEPKRKPKIKYLGQCLGRVQSKASSSLRPAPGGGVLACIDKSSSDLDSSGKREGIIGTLTMFCLHDNHHYALTCFHVACATDENRLNATLNKKEDILAIRSLRSTYEEYAKEQQYYFAESVENNDDAMPSPDNTINCTPLGDFHKYRFDDKCDIMSLKVSGDTEIDCRIPGITSPNWNQISKEFYKRVFRTGHKRVEVEKIGFSSALTHGHVVPCDLSDESLFKNAIVVKGNSGAFLKGGDSGSLVFFHDKNNQKQVFAYGVCEIDELPITKRHESANSTSQENVPSEQAQSCADDNSDDSSIWSEEEEDNSESDFEVEFQESNGSYFICLRLDTALENLGLHEAACFSNCKRQTIGIRNELA